MKFEVKNMKLKLDFLLFKRAWYALAISGLLIFAIGQYTNIDLLIEDYYFDRALNAFPWRHSWFASDLMHGYVKNVIVNGGYLLYLFLLIDCIKPWKNLLPLVRFRLRFVAIASILIPLFVRLIKQHSVLHCPWSVDRY